MGHFDPDMSLSKFSSRVGHESYYNTETEREKIWLRVVSFGEDFNEDRVVVMETDDFCRLKQPLFFRHSHLPCCSPSQDSRHRVKPAQQLSKHIVL